jgi:hypothetical protein
VLQTNKINDIQHNFPLYIYMRNAKDTLTNTLYWTLYQLLDHVIMFLKSCNWEPVQLVWLKHNASFFEQKKLKEASCLSPYRAEHQTKLMGSLASLSLYLFFFYLFINATLLDLRPLFVDLLMIDLKTMTLFNFLYFHKVVMFCIDLRHWCFFILFWQAS